MIIPVWLLWVLGVPLALFFTICAVIGFLLLCVIVINGEFNYKWR